MPATSPRFASAGAGNTAALQLEPGQLLLHYRLVDRVGEGGMGVVWRAVDTTLDRQVAVKVLPDVFASDPDRAARFDREARVLASLNHPNITHVHSVHHTDGVRFLVMEFAHGENLADRIARGRIPLEDALVIAKQVALAIEAAHESGVVHRDLKPANITVTGDNKVEVLDFGLAKAFDAAGGSGSDLSRSPTVISGHTAAGVILGTAAYMSPEQARGKSVDRRTDIWSFGCVLYEMLTGNRAFDGETVTDVLAAVVTRDPDWASIPAATPARVRELLRRCLEKDPQRRLRDAGEIRIAIEDVIARPQSDIAAAPAPLPSPVRDHARRWPWVVVGAAIVLAAAAWLLPRGRPAVEPTHLNISVPPGDVVDGGFENAMLAITRDGRMVAFSARRAGVTRLYLRRFDSAEATEISGTEGAHSPFFSPDGKWIAFVSGDRMRKVEVAGGPVFDLATVSSDRSGVWLDDGSIVFAPRATRGLMRLPSAGGVPPTVLTPIDSIAGERTHRWPDVLPGDEWVIYTVGTASSPGDYEDATIAAVSVKTGERRELYRGAAMARFAPPHHLILSRNGVLLAAPIDVSNPRLTGAPAPILDRVAREPTSGVVHFVVARNGTMVHVPQLAGEDEIELVWVDHAGTVTALGAPEEPYIASRVSPDGRRVLSTVGRTFASGDVWMFDMDRGTTTRVTFDERSLLMYWTPDQRHMVYQTQDKDFHIVVHNLDGSGSDRVIHTHNAPIVISGVTPDGRWVLFSEWGTTESDIYRVPIDGSAAPEVVISEFADQGDGRVSSDGRWIVYESRMTGQIEVFIRPYPSGAGKWQISTGGGVKPLWSPRGDEVYWISSGAMFAISVESQGGSLALGRPRKLFDIPPGRRGDTDFLAHDLSPDGSRFLMTRVAHPELSRRRLDVILNFSEKLEHPAR